MASARSAPWSTAAIPDQTGRVAVVTGANSGIGLHTALELARAGARVVMACRDEGRARAAHDRIMREVPMAEVETRRLDLAQLASVRAFAYAWEGPLDLLVNNAGVMAPPFRLTSDGFELQLGTNHLGHFALTGLLLPLFADREGARVVTVSSLAHRMGRIDFDDLQSERAYRKWTAYAQSKLANLLFTFELDRRLTGHPVIAVGAHPGIASTNLQVAGPRMQGSRFGAAVIKVGTLAVSQSAAHGAWPSLYATTAPDVRGGEYFGPRKLGETRGSPRRVGTADAAKDPEAAARLWEVSEQLTGVTYEVPGLLRDPGPDVAGEGFEPS
jgi:NAD(P)-dependent dehydrogenase (short-subunit alcohol dehydrogenase family)